MFDKVAEVDFAGVKLFRAIFLVVKYFGAICEVMKVSSHVLLVIGKVLT